MTNITTTTITISNTLTMTFVHSICVDFFNIKQSYWHNHQQNDHHHNIPLITTILIKINKSTSITWIKMLREEQISGKNHYHYYYHHHHHHNQGLPDWSHHHHHHHHYHHRHRHHGTTWLKLQSEEQRRALVRWVPPPGKPGGISCFLTYLYLQ